MPKLINNTDRPIGATTGHIVPANGELSVSNATLDRISNEAYIKGQIAKNSLTVAGDDPVESSKPITRKDIAKMKRADLVELLEAQGCEDLVGTADDLREIAVNVIFTSL